ncbi:hypothetical protein GO491_08795 [Flavobacteriaceae bacterium Ap0902]|nr:hypothetical protein [Flavobacteriaceae bacterium Ap0902]
MKKSILILIVVLFAGIQQASARISVGKTENIKVVHEFPNTEEYMTNPGRFFDLGILYETFDIAGMPLWVSKDPVLVGTENLNTEFYLEFDEVTADEIVASHNLNKEELLKLSFMDKYSGWLLILGVIVLYLLYMKFFGSKDEGEYHDNGDEIETIEKEDRTIIAKKN